MKTSQNSDKSHLFSW